MKQKGLYHWYDGNGVNFPRIGDLVKITNISFLGTGVSLNKNNIYKVKFVYSDLEDVIISQYGSYKFSINNKSFNYPTRHLKLIERLSKQYDLEQINMFTM